MFVNPYLLAHEFPRDPSIISKAIQLANQPIDQYRDVRYLMSILLRMEVVHDRLRRHAFRRKSLIAGSDFDIQPVSEEYTQMALDAKERLSETILDLYDTYLSGTFYGVGLTKLYYMPSEIGFKPFIDKQFSPVELEKNPDYFNNLAILSDAPGMMYVREAMLEEERHLYIAYTDNNHERGGLFRALIYKVFLMNMAEQEWASFLQFMKGIIQAKVQAGASPADKKAAVDAVQSAVDNKFTVTSDLVDFAFHEIASKDSGGSFDQFLTKMEMDIEVAITGTSALASDRLRNAPTVQERNEEDMAVWGRRDFAKLINTQLIKHDYFMNVDKSAWGLDVPYKFVYKPKLTADKKVNHDMIMDLLDHGANISVGEYEQKTGIILAKEGDIVIQTTPAFQSPAPQVTPIN